MVVRAKIKVLDVGYAKKRRTKHITAVNVITYSSDYYILLLIFQADIYNSVSLFLAK